MIKYAERRKAPVWGKGRNEMKKWVIALLLAMTVSGCRRYEPVTELPGVEAEAGEGTEETGEYAADGVSDQGQDGQVRDGAASQSQDGQSGDSAGGLGQDGQSGDSAGGLGQDGQSGDSVSGQAQDEYAADEIFITTLPERTPVKVKGIYVSAYVAGTKARMDELIQLLDETELNAVVIDVKDDNGRITFAMDSPQAQAIGACENYIPDIEELSRTLKEHGIYMIARIPAFRDPYLAEAKPEWCLKLADGSVFRDRNKLAWVNPYKEEVWDYLVEIGKKAGEAGFDEIQFDYIRFCTEKGMDQVVFDPEETKGRSRQDIILEFVRYAYEELRKEGLFVSADVFGAVIGGGQDAETVGQEYSAMAAELDYICPMIYPSHYADGNFGLEHPDTQPYETILAALGDSAEDLSAVWTAGGTTGTVRPWLQAFTASYLKTYIPYGPEQIRQQIQAVYDAGCEEWILWNASVRYDSGGLLTEEQGQAEAAAREAAAQNMQSE